MDDETLERLHIIEGFSRTPLGALFFLLFVLPFWLSEKLGKRKPSETEELEELPKVPQE